MNLGSGKHFRNPRIGPDAAHAQPAREPKNRFRKFQGRVHRVILPFRSARISLNSGDESRAHHSIAITIFPKCAALSMWRSAAGASLKGNVASIAGFSAASAIALFMVRNCSREPTYTP